MIDEKKLIEDIKNTFSDSVLNQTFGFGKYTLLEAIEEMINRQPQVETDTNVGSNWIPCEERLPECESGCETKELMFQMKDTDTIEVGYYGEGGYYRNRYFRTYRDMFEGVDVSDVIAWQPLPQPYKKEGAE